MTKIYFIEICVFNPKIPVFTHILLCVFICVFVSVNNERVWIENEEGFCHTFQFIWMGCRPVQDSTWIVSMVRVVHGDFHLYNCRCVYVWLNRKLSHDIHHYIVVFPLEMGEHNFSFGIHKSRIMEYTFNAYVIVCTSISIEDTSILLLLNRTGRGRVSECQA